MTSPFVQSANDADYTYKFTCTATDALDEHSPSDIFSLKVTINDEVTENTALVLADFNVILEDTDTICLKNVCKSTENDV